MASSVCYIQYSANKKPSEDFPEKTSLPLDIPQITPAAPLGVNKSITFSLNDGLFN